MAERPSDDQRNSATFAALMMVLLVSGSLLALAAVVLPQVLWMVVIVVVLGLSVVLQYFVWGRWLTSVLRAQEEAQQQTPNEPADRK